MNDFKKRELSIYTGFETKLNSALCQVLSGGVSPWFLERFVNVISYKKHGQYIIDLVQNNNEFYEECVETMHVYTAGGLPQENFEDFVSSSILAGRYINIWCDEYYVSVSPRYKQNHFVHPITIYGVDGHILYCEFFHSEKGLTFVKIPIGEIKAGFYSVETYYYLGADYDVLKHTLSTYVVKTRASDAFNLTRFIGELSNYVYSCNDLKCDNNFYVDGNDITFGIGYYNYLLYAISSEQEYFSLRYKCIFDMYMHKLFLKDRFQYIKKHYSVDLKCDEYITAFDRVCKIYEKITKLNLKYNIKNKIQPAILSADAKFKEVFSSLIQEAFDIEMEVLPRILHGLVALKNNSEGSSNMETKDCSSVNSFLFEFSPIYTTRIDVMVKSLPNEGFPIKLITSNGYIYLLNSAVEKNTICTPLMSVSWIKIENCYSVVELNVNTASEENCKWNNKEDFHQWKPQNHIENVLVTERCLQFEIVGNDPYIINDHINLIASLCQYIYIDFCSEDIGTQAQLFFMTDISPMYSVEKSCLFNVSNSNKRYLYKIDMSGVESWKSLIRLIRFDPVNEAQSYISMSIRAKARIFGIYINNNSPVYSNMEDFIDRQFVNQWSYWCIRRGDYLKLEYCLLDGLWKYNDVISIGQSYQLSTNEYYCCRRWECPSSGEYLLCITAEFYCGNSCILRINKKECLVDSMNDNSINILR